MTTVQSARGPIDPSDLGRVLMHEHVFVLTPDSQRQWSDEWDEEEQVANAIVKLNELAAQGISTIADPTVDGLGRDIARIARIAAEVDLNIIVATGVYTYHDVPNFFVFRGPGLIPGLDDPMVDFFVRDLEEGVRGTAVRAAFLKCAIDHYGLTPGVERVLRAEAAAHLRTGAPMMVHTHPGTQTGLEVKRVLGEEGVSFDRVILAHSGDTTDADHLSELAEAGFLLGMDRFGIDATLDFDSRVGIVVELCRRGFSGQMVLAQDASCYIDWIDPAFKGALPNWNYLHVLADVVPALLERGVTESQVDEMLVGNPRRYFGG
ncbi:MAG: phosphotriesterase [Acidimicrobiales bacterium]|jgi:phosphotriesterase-related protein